MTVSVGDAGSAVGHAHQRLIELGYPIDADELADAAFGPTTLAAVRAFQQDQALDPDGIIGIQTAHRLDHPGNTGRHTAAGWRYDRDRVHIELLRVCDAAVADLGLREDPDGSNDGPDLKKFRTRGAPWCALALSSWMEHYETGSPWGRLASTWDIYQWARARGRIVEDTRPGDVWFRGRANRRGHVALVVTVLPDGCLACVGGNEANSVRGSLRRREDATAIIRPVAL
jgi:hypothetical protein